MVMVRSRRIPALPCTDWNSVVISTFAVVILSVIGALFKVRASYLRSHNQSLTCLQSNNHLVMGSKENPKDGAAAAGAIFGAVIVYACFLVFCGFQALLHHRDSRRGQIALS